MRRDKLVVVFDEAARKDYLTGFHKRKVERRKVAEEKRKTMEKEARREAKMEVRTAVGQSNRVTMERGSATAAGILS
jgi:ribosomal RNA-processing protein 17